MIIRAEIFPRSLVGILAVVTCCMLFSCCVHPSGNQEDADALIDEIDAELGGVEFLGDRTPEGARSTAVVLGQEEVGAVLGTNAFRSLGDADRWYALAEAIYCNLERVSIGTDLAIDVYVPLRDWQEAEGVGLGIDSVHSITVLLRKSFSQSVDQDSFAIPALGFRLPQNCSPQSMCVRQVRRKKPPPG